MKNIKIKLLYLVILLFIAACSGRVTPSQYEQAQELAANNGGIETVYADDVSVKVKCKNGAWFYGIADREKK